MSENEYKDLSRYFKLITYREDGSLLLDEYYELTDILNRNPVARKIDDAYYDFLKGKISEEEYNNIFNYYNDDLMENYIRKLISY